MKMDIDIMNIVVLLIGNIYVEFWGQMFQQAHDILLSLTFWKCGKLLVNPILWESLLPHVWVTEHGVAMSFNFTSDIFMRNRPHNQNCGMFLRMVYPLED